MVAEAHFSLIWKSVFPFFWLGALLAVSNQQLNFCNWKSPQSSAAGSQTSASQVLQKYFSTLLHIFVKLITWIFQVENHQNPLQQNPKPVPVRFSNIKCFGESDYKHLPIFVHLASLLFGLLGTPAINPNFAFQLGQSLVERITLKCLVKCNIYPPTRNGTRSIALKLHSNSFRGKW